jgi:hypothetical protein
MHCSALACMSLWVCLFVQLTVGTPSRVKFTTQRLNLLVGLGGLNLRERAHDVNRIYEVWPISDTRCVCMQAWLGACDQFFIQECCHVMFAVRQPQDRNQYAHIQF